MYRSGSGRASPPSSSRAKESRGSGTSRASRSAASMSAATRGRSPRRSRSPSPRGRRHRSPSSSRSSRRSSRRSPSPRRSSRVRSPSGGSWGRRGSEQRDGSLSRRLSLGGQPQFASRHSPNRHSESSEEQNLRPAVDDDCYGIDPLERRKQSDRVGFPVDSLNNVDRSDFADFPVYSRHLSCPQSHQRYSSPEGSPPSSFSRRYIKDYHSKKVFVYQLDFNQNCDHLQDLSREPDRDGELFRKHLYSLEERGQKQNHPQYDREDRLLDVNIDHHGLLPGKQNYYKRILSRSPTPKYPDEDCRDPENSRSDKKTRQDIPGSSYMIPGLTDSSEPQFLHTPENAPAMPKKSILKKRVDDPSVQVENFLKCFNKNAVIESAKKESQAFVEDWKAFFGLQPNAFPTKQNSEGFLRKKEYQESISESADLHDDFLLPHERASQDGSGTSHILDRVADPTCAQEQRRHSFLDVEDEEKFLYGDDDNNDSNISCPTEQLIMNGKKESVSLNKRPPSPKLDACDRSKTDYEKIHDLLKTIGLDIGLSEIDGGGARTQERLHGRKTLRPQDGPSHKADTSEEDSIQSSTHSSGTNWKNSLSPCDSSQASNDASSTLISEYAKSKTLDYDHSAGPSEQYFPSVSTVTPSAPPLLPNLPPPPPPPQVSQYSLSQFSAVLAAQVLQNYLGPTMSPPSYNAYPPRVAYSAPAWPMYTPPQQSNPAPPDVHGLVSMTVPLQPTQCNLNVVETKENPEIKRNKSVLVEVPIIPGNSGLLPQASDSDTIERISNRKNPVSEKPQVTEEGEKLMFEQEAQQKKLAFLRTEFHRRCKQQWGMLRNKQKARGKEKDPLLVEMKRVQESIVKDICQLQMACHTAEMEVSS